MVRWRSSDSCYLRLVLSVAIVTLLAGMFLVIPTPPARAQDAAEVQVVDFAFEPANVTVSVGATVTWTNGDDITHTVTSGAPGKKDARFDGRLDGKGTAYRHTFTEPGTYSYFCDRHQAMTGQILVK